MTIRVFYRGAYFFDGYISMIKRCSLIFPLKSEVHLDADSAAVDAWDVAVVDAPHVVDT